MRSYEVKLSEGMIAEEMKLMKEENTARKSFYL